MKVKSFVKAALAFLFKDRRFFYICVCIISVWNMTSIFVPMMARFKTDSTSIGIRTSYIRWTNTFPAMSICLAKYKTPYDLMAQMLRSYGVNSSFSYVRTIYDYLFINSNNFNLKQENCAKLNSTCGVDIRKLRRDLLPTTCDQFMSKVYFSEILVPDCRKIFKFHEMEMGYCFLANNIIDYDKLESLPLKYSSFNNKRKLRIHFNHESYYRYDLYVHSPEDIPYFNAISYTITNQSVFFYYNVNEIYNNIEVKDKNIHQRMCTFLTENNENKYYRLIEKDTKPNEDITAEINIASPPSTRYYRTVTQTKLDLTVAIGGVLGLCLGASSLNILEIIYFSLKKIYRILNQ